MDAKKLILVQGHECLYNLQLKDYDNNFVKDNSWKETVGEQLFEICQENSNFVKIYTNYGPFARRPVYVVHIALRYS
jgi:hypothetical protein